MSQSAPSSNLCVIAVAASVAMAGMTFGYDVAVNNGVLVLLQARFHLDPFALEMVPTVTLLGCGAGAAWSGWASDRFGRRRILLSAGVLFCLAALLAISSASFRHLMVARVLAGLALGAATLVAPLYIAEISPVRLRGRLVTMNQLATVSGILAGFVMNYAMARLSPDNWRLMFGIGAVPALLLSISVLWIPESPRWLIQQGRRERALSILRRLSPVGAEAALSEITSAIQEETGSYRELLGRSLRKPLVLTVMLAIIQQATGINAVLYYGGIIFSQHRGATPSAALGMNILVGVVNLLFTLTGLFFIDKLGRRPLLLTATAGMAVCLAALVLTLHSRPGNTILLLVPVLGYVAFFAYGLGTGVWVCLAELFPNRIRGRAMSVATMVLWLSVSCVTATFLTLMKTFSESQVFLGYSVVCAVSFAYIYVSLPETRNCSLEDVASLWLKQGA